MMQNINEYQTVIDANEGRCHQREQIIFGRIILKCESLYCSKVAQERVHWQAVFVGEVLFRD
jgi:hypothetical protein